MRTKYQIQRRSNWPRNAIKWPKQSCDTLSIYLCSELVLPWGLVYVWLDSGGGLVDALVLGVPCESHL